MKGNSLNGVSEPLIVLSRGDVLDLLTLHDCIRAVERAFRLHAEGRTLGPGVLGVPAADGGFHIKAAGLVGERSYFAAKTNANFPENPRRFGLPTIQGTIVLADASTGALLAIIESGSVTALRTGAATAVAAKFLARRDARTATIVGCGVQGELQLAAIAAVLPLERAWVLDTDYERAASMAARATASLGLRVEAAKDLRAALRESDVCVTCTPARRAFVTTGDVRPGTFIAAVGADNRGKQELEPALVVSATLVVDVLEQCAEIGELQHVLAAGLMTRAQVHAELADVVVGRRPGRTRDDEITVFDSSGTALQDVAAAVAVYEKARATGRGTEVKLDG
ncbi:MAG TPA: ornithine cyclodeaminase family protein [Methylomirabilota bacterium]|jgi:ornithine cyclodeaminase/alanine dehydrogenase-like protein (mu-crystallin family)|nr:ornithine cyclodeaminase family protein [Methylomirabilota bacterium]